MKFKNLFGWVVVVVAMLMLSSFASAATFEMHSGMVSTNAFKYTAVAYGNDTFVQVWYSSTGAYMNATAIDAYTGYVVKNATLSKDVYTYNSAPSIRPTIAYDPVDKDFLVVWVNSSKCLEGMVIDSNLNVLMGEFNINGSVSVGYKGISLAYGNGTFLVVWSDGGYQLEGRFLAKDYMSPVFRITKYQSKYQQKPWVAFDPSSKRFMVTWINVTASGTTKFYNMTGRIIGFSNGNIVNYTGDILMGDTISSHISYSSPAVAGGGGCFMITYVDYSTYDIFAKVYSSAGEYITTMVIDKTYKYGRNPMPVVYNGSAFIVTWSNSTESILSKAYSVNGTPISKVKVIYSGADGGNPEVAYSPDENTYLFSWSEYNRATYGIGYAVLTADEYSVPEFSLTLSGLLVAAVGIIILWRRKS